MYVDCNRSNCDDKDTTDNTNIWNFKLKSELKLNTGTQISISQSFINQKGINGASIEIERDYVEAINYYFYITETLHAIPKKAAQAPLFENCLIPFRYEKMFGAGTGANTAQFLTGASEHGGSCIPLVLYETIVIDGVRYIKPAFSQKRIQVKKGIYGINQLTDLLNDQINGVRDLDGNYTKPFQANVLDGSYTGNMAQSGAGLTRVVTPYNHKLINDARDPTNNEVVNLTAGHVFIPIDKHRELLELNKNQDEIPMFVWNNYNNAILGGAFFILVDNQTVDNTGDADILNYNLGVKGYTIGTTEFKIMYNSENNGFSLNNLHSSYRINTLDRKSNQNLNEGEVALQTRSCTIDGINTENDPNKTLIKSTLNTPLTRLGGVIVHNFSFLKSVSDSKRADTRHMNDFNTYKEIFNNDIQGNISWKKTLWYRIGFSYKQLNDISQFEKFKIYNKPLVSTSHLGGITTDAQIDIGVYNQLSCKTNPFLMTHPNTNDKVGSFSSYSFIPSNTPKIGVVVAYADNNNVTSYDGSPYDNSTVVNVLTSGRPLIADNLPTLSEFGYYLITSNCVPNYNDILGKGTPLPLLGVVPKSSLSNQDFIQSSNDIINTITNPIIINSIKINVLNPDLSSPDLAENSSVIIKFEIPEDEPQGK